MSVAENIWEKLFLERVQKNSEALPERVPNELGSGSRTRPKNNFLLKIQYIRYLSAKYIFTIYEKEVDCFLA